MLLMIGYVIDEMNKNITFYIANIINILILGKKGVFPPIMHKSN